VDPHPSPRSRSLLARRSRAPSPPAVYLLSPGRSGSKMLALALDLHPRIRALHEPGDPATMCALAFDAWRGPVAQERVDRALRRRPRGARRPPGDPRVWVESAHWHSMLVPYLAARYVHLVRPGREFVRSGLPRPWYTDRQVPAWRPHQLDPPEELSTRFEKICWLWAEYHRRILRDLEAVPPSDRLLLRVGPGGIDWQGLVGGFLGLELAPEHLAAMREIERRRPNASPAPTPAWTEEMERAYRAICGPVESALRSRE
jgi:hypothetical protein